PGTKAVYCSATMNLLGAMLRSPRDMFFDDFAAPLGLFRPEIAVMPDGRAYLGGGVRLRAVDFLELPQLVLDHGKWDGRQVVSAAWLDAATAPHASINGPDDYGYGWWRQRYTV